MFKPQNFPYTPTTPVTHLLFCQKMDNKLVTYNFTKMGEQILSFIEIDKSLISDVIKCHLAIKASDKGGLYRHSFNCQHQEEQVVEPINNTLDIDTFLDPFTRMESIENHRPPHRRYEFTMNAKDAGTKTLASFSEEPKVVLGAYVTKYCNFCSVDDEREKNPDQSDKNQCDGNQCDEKNDKKFVSPIYVCVGKNVQSFKSFSSGVSTDFGLGPKSEIHHIDVINPGNNAQRLTFSNAKIDMTNASLEYILANASCPQILCELKKLQISGHQNSNAQSATDDDKLVSIANKLPCFTVEVPQNHIMTKILQNPIVAQQLQTKFNFYPPYFESSYQIPFIVMLYLCLQLNQHEIFNHLVDENSPAVVKLYYHDGEEVICTPNHCYITIAIDYVLNSEILASCYEFECAPDDAQN